MLSFLTSLLLLFSAGSSAPIVDSTKVAAMDSLLVKFYKALEREDFAEKERAADFLIGTVSDSLLKQHVAVDIFDYYRYSKLMGDESVAIYVYDKWFAPGKVSFYGEMSQLDADVFVKFNRNSQLGMTAPVVELYKANGKKTAIPRGGRTSIIFFYDTSCAKCRLESKLFPQILEKIDFEMDFYAVYSGCDNKSWRQFRKEFRIKNKKIHVMHLWDPELDSGYQLEYGVTGTPRIFMVEPQGSILGRRLEVENIIQLLPYATALQAAYDEQIR